VGHAAEEEEEEEGILHQSTDWLGRPSPK